MRPLRLTIAVAAMLNAAVAAAGPQSEPLPTPSRAAIAAEIGDLTATERTRVLIREVMAASYPSLQSVDLRIGTFASESDYFKTSFSAGRFVSGAPMRYQINVNPEWLRRLAPDEAVRAILAHELAHVMELSRGKRLRLVGLVGLVFPGTAARFERRTDLEAIARHYGEGLKAYRQWLYENVPAAAQRQKRRNYFSPEEIDAILERMDGHPERLAYWFRHVPMNLEEITARP